MSAVSTIMDSTVSEYPDPGLGAGAGAGLEPRRLTPRVGQMVAGLSYANRRRVNGAYGKHLLRKRGELIERSFAHCYDTGGMRRTHLRGHQNILKRLLIHVGAFNLSLIFRTLWGSGTPRELRNRRSSFVVVLLWLLDRSSAPARRPSSSFSSSRLNRRQNHRYLR